MGAFQAAKGTVVTDFTNATLLWTRTNETSFGTIKSDAQGMEEAQAGYATAASYVVANAPTAMCSALATRTALELVLTSNFGAFAAGAFTLATQVTDSRWLTLAFVENAAGGTQRLVRLRDGWAHKVSLVLDGRGALVMEAEFAARVPLTQLLNAGGVTLPAAPMNPSREVFPGADTHARFTRDPAGANVQLRTRSLRLTFDQGLSHEYSMGTGLFEVSKQGKLRARVEMTGDYSDETWVELANSFAGTKQRHRLVCDTENALSTLMIDLYEVQWEIPVVGHEGRSYRELSIAGEAHVLSAGNFVSIGLT